MKTAIPWAVAAALASAWLINSQLAAQEGQDPAAGDAEQRPAENVRLAHAEAMLESAQKAYEAFLVEYELGQARLDNVYPWSRRLLQAELALIRTQWDGDELRIKASRTEACRKHLARMEQLHEKVAALFKANAFGGEASNYFATQYYVAEAKLWAAGGKLPVE